MNINEFEVFNKTNFLPYKSKLDNFFDQVTKGSDKLAKNYDIDYNELDDLTLIVHKGEIVAFSSVLYRNTWPKNCRRILNRFIRNKSLEWTDNTFGTLSRIMHDKQIEFCKENKIDFVFLSMQGNKRNYFKRWSQQANLYSPGWVQVDGMIKVCNGTPANCVQHIVYKNITNTPEKFGMLTNIISYAEYETMISV